VAEVLVPGPGSSFVIIDSGRQVEPLLYCSGLGWSAKDSVMHALQDTNKLLDTDIQKAHAGRAIPILFVARLQPILPYNANRNFLG
jgi:hypothetical protein